MSSKPDSVPLVHQQQGGFSPAAFAAREGITIKQLHRYIKLRLVLGAQQDSRSKRWWIYPPARLLTGSQL